MFVTREYSKLRALLAQSYLHRLCYHYYFVSIVRMTDARVKLDLTFFRCISAKTYHCVILCKRTRGRKRESIVTLV